MAKSKVQIELERTRTQLEMANAQVELLLKTTKDLAAQVATHEETATKQKQENEALLAKIGQPVRRRLPDTRQAVTHKFNIGGHEGYMTVGMFSDGSPGELFVTMAKEGSTIGGLMDTIGTLTSISLQYGVNMETLAKKFAHQRFEPSGYTSNVEIKTASSVIDYVFRWMEIYFVRSRTVSEGEIESHEQSLLPPPEPVS